MNHLLGDYAGFVQALNSGLEAAGVSRDDLVLCDHLCYRVETDRRYAEMKDSLTAIAKNIGEVSVAGRLISTFELDEPLQTGGWTIPCVELPAPKPGSPYVEGLEHAEFVVVNLERFIDSYIQLPFNTKAMGKQINPELGLALHKGVSVKFHEIALGAVVRLEGRLAGV